MACNEENDEKEYGYREYQVDLYNAAKEQNIIACLGTGTGKTYIAILLMIDPMFLPQLNGSYRSGEAKRTFFLVPTRPLVHQQAQAIRTAPSITNLKEYVIEITGDLNVDNWDKELWDEVLEQNKVIVMTADILKNMLNHNLITFDKINLLIIDEIHWGAQTKKGKPSGHSYKQIMNIYNRLDKNCRPRVLGLSATPINCSMRVESFDDALADIENTYSAKCMTGDAGMYGTNPEEIVWCFNNYETTLSPSGLLVKKSLDFFIESLKTTQNNLKELLKKHKKDKREIPSIVSRMKKSLTTIRNILAEPSQNSFIIDEQSGERFPLFMTWMGTWCASLAVRFYVDEITQYKDIYKDVDPFHAKIMDCCLKYLNFILKCLAPELDSDPMAALNTVSPKMLRLLELLKNDRTYSNENSIICGIIFVNQRCVAKVLANWLMEIKRIQPQYYDFLNVGWVVGHSARPGLETKIASNSDKKQQKIIEDFKNNKLNLLVATSVLEEGLDVRECNLVVRYDKLNTFREYLQSKGRARAQNASYYILTSNEDNQKLSQKLCDFRQMEEKVKNINNRVHTEYQPQEDEEEEGDAYISPTGARITARSAIQLLYMYCQRLPSDSFTRLEPELKIIYELNCFKGTVKMPVNCPLKGTTEGPLKRSSDNAKRAVALKACQMLHQLGELDDHLLPVNKEKCIQEYIEKLGLRKDTFSTDSSEKVGTRSRKQEVFKQIANVFTNNSNEKNKYYLQRISINFHKTIPLPDNCLTFGALTPKEITTCSEFPVYLKTIPTEATDGTKININVKQINEILLNGEQKEMIEKFHCIVFEEVIRLSVKEYDFDPINSNFNLLVVPLINKQEIDWSFIQTINTSGAVFDVKPVSPVDRQRYVFNEQSFNDTVFSPWYQKVDANGRPFIYYSLGITTLTSNSAWIGTQTFTTFDDFYRRKKEIEIQNKSHPLIEGYCISRQFKGGPKCAQLKLMSYSKKSNPKFGQYFPPELVCIHHFPASLWRQALCLPALLYRMNHLLLAEELRKRIQLEAIPRIRPLIELSNELNLNYDSKSDTNSEPNDSKRKYNSIDSDDECGGHIIYDQFEDIPYKHPFPKRKCKESQQIRQCLDKTKKATQSTIVNNPLVITSDSPLSSLMDYTDAMVHNFQQLVSDHITGTHKQIVEQITYAQILSETSAKPMEALPEIRYGEAFPFIFNGDIQSYIRDKYDARVGDPIVGPNTNLILQALTTIGANDAFNFERLEVIGDSFLKFVSSAFVYFSCPELDEGRLSYLRQIQICNCNLYFIGCEKQIENLLVTHQWFPNTNWLPPSYHISDENDLKLLNQEDRTCGAYKQRYIGNKTIADSVEALIGAHLLIGGTKTALIFMEWLGLKVAPNGTPIDYENKQNLNEDQLFRWLPIPKNPICYETTQEEIDRFINRHYNGFNLKNFEEIIGYEFRNKAFLIQALTHSSFYSNEFTDCYQKLEFLGDSIIDYLISRHIYGLPDKNYNPGELTNLRSALVNNAFFAAICVKYKFHKYLKAFSPELFRAIQNFEKNFSEGEAETIKQSFSNLTEDECNDLEHIEVPKALGDIFESIAGAIYLDNGQSLDGVWKVYYRLLKPEIDYFSENIPIMPVQQVWELCASRKCDPDFGKSEKIGRKTKVVLKIVGNESDYAGAGKEYGGIGKNRKFAKIAASKSFLKDFSNNSNQN